jgi:dihydroflavonol-4-reductase
MDQTSQIEAEVQANSRVFVTGATGLLGSNLVRELRARGTRVRALVGSAEKARRYLADADVELVVGDMERVAEFEHLLSDCQAVFHTAAYFREYHQPRDHDEQLERINVQGTLALMRAADARGVSVFVHTSSSGAVGTKPDGSPGDEDTAPGTLQRDNRYFRSKVSGDRAIQAWQPPHGMRVLEILPGWMWGPGDAAPTASGQLALDFAAKKVPVVPEGGTNVVDARDVALAMIAAATRGQHGSRFIVAGEFRSLETVLQDLQTITQVRGPRLKVPFALAMGYAYFEELRARLTGGKLLVSREALLLLRARHNVTSARAQRELGTTFRPFEQTLRDTLAWYREHGFLSPVASEPAARRALGDAVFRSSRSAELFGPGMEKS